MASMNGTIKRLVSDKGFGFILASDGNEYFFHQSGCRDVMFDQLREAQAVTFERGQGPKGPRAENVKLVLPDPVTRPRGSVAVRPLRHHACGGASSFVTSPARFVVVALARRPRGPRGPPRPGAHS